MTDEQTCEVGDSSPEEIDEFDELLDALPLRQGDIFEWLTPFRERPWRELGVIVTADCDMANSKIGEVVSFVPLLSFEDYVWHFWREKRFEPQFKLALADLAKFINKQLSKQGKAEISSEAASDWIQRETSETLAAAIGVVDGSLKKKFDDLCARFSDMDRLLKAESCDVALLVRAADHLKKESQLATDFLADVLQNSLTNLPGDIFYLSQVGPESGGAFAMLRHIRQCGRSEIAIDPDQIRFGIAKSRRIARLRPTFKYSLTQQMARVFSDIGLPDSYDVRVKSRSAKFFGSLSR